MKKNDQTNKIIVIGSLFPSKKCQDRVRVLNTDGICQALRATDYKDPPKIPFADEMLLIEEDGGLI